MILFNKFLCGLCCIFVIIETASSQDLLDYPNSLKYADYLFQTKQYNLSSIEYERVVFLEPRDTQAKLNLVRSYRYLKNYKTAWERINNFFPHNLNCIPEEFAGEYIKILLFESQFQEASSYLKTNITLNSTAKVEYQLGILVMQQQWTEAKSFADEHTDLLTETEKFESLNKVITDGLGTRYKSPPVAASLSVIVPGAGKAYTGQWKDAIFSFLFVTTAAWLTYRSYNKSELNFTTIALGTVTLSFYSANIYGSTKSAKRYNQKTNQSYSRQARDILLNE